MELTYQQFTLLHALYAHRTSGVRLSQRELAELTKCSLGSVNAVLRALKHQELIDQGQITELGLRALEPYRVHNAVILAAGLSSRFSPISYEKPKGLITVRGEVLIERQIRQLHDAGITDITVVVGYKQEQFFYLEDKFDVNIVPNTEYRVRNNHSSLMAVADKLTNTYICSSDNYFEVNPFETYVWKAYYAAQYQQGATKEWCLEVGAHQRITSVTIGGHDAWYMIGHVYFDTEFSHKFVEILRKEYDNEQTRDKLWEDLYIEHLTELDMRIRCYDPAIIYEFDSLDELREFDPLFLENIDSEVFDRISKVLDCKKTDIHDVYPLKNGLTNLSCHFTVGTHEYVYRHPGVGTDVLIDRHAEYEALHAAQQLGLDATFVAADPQHGWKISHFLKDCRIVDFHNTQDLREGMKLIHALHASTLSVERSFDFYEESQRYLRALKDNNVTLPIDIADLTKKVDRLRQEVLAETEHPVHCLSHNDLLSANVLVDSTGRYHLIDWEYAGMSDYAQDLGTMCVSDEFTEKEFDHALTAYFGRTPTLEEHRHCLAYVGFAGWCWYLWALVKESDGEPVEQCRYLYYRYAKRYVIRALNEYAMRSACVDKSVEELHR